MKNMIKRISLLVLVIALCLGMASSALAACTATITAGSLNVRAGVGTGYKVLKALPHDTQVYYLGVSDVDSNGDTWYKVQYGAYQTGWLSAAYCDLSGQTVTTSYCRAESGDSYIRSNPHLEGSKLDVIHQGETASYLGQICTDMRGVDWYYINFNGTYGWVSSMYTNLYSQTSVSMIMMPSLPTYGATKATVKSEGGQAYIRSEGSLQGRELSVLKEGVSASYLGERSVDNRGVVWFKISANGVTGWISSRYAMLYGNASSSNTGSSSNYVKATGGQCNVRTGPSLDAKSIGVMEKGESASYLKETSVDDRGVIWFKVKFDGKTGWVSSKYASLNGSSYNYGNAFGSYVEATGKTNIRKEPNLDGKILGNIDKGETATFLGATSTDNRGVEWYNVRYDGKTGWVSSKYTELY